MLSPTSPDVLTDARGRPYFLWDCDLTVAEFQERLRVPDANVRAYFLAKLMRQAKPDDVFAFVELRTVRAMWPHLERYLGSARPFWTWLLDTWNRQADGGR